MIKGNPPLAIEMTVPITEFGTDLRRWDLEYQRKARICGVFLACQPQFLELQNPPIITIAVARESPISKRAISFINLHESMDTAPLHDKKYVTIIVTFLGR